MLTSQIINAFRAAPGGLLPARSLRRLGLDYPELIELAQRDVLVRPLHGVYGLPEPHADRHLALPLTYLDQRRPPGHMPALLTGAAALSLRSVEPMSQSASATGPPQVLVDSRCRARTDHERFRVIRGGAPSTPSNLIQGLRAATVDRCLIDLSGDPDITDAQVRMTVDDLRRQRMATLPQLARSWRVSRATGVARLERLARSLALDMESEGERDFFDLVLRDHPVWPDFQVVVTESIRVDFMFIRAGLILEYHGERWHNQRADEDATRAHALERLDLAVMAVTKSMMKHPRELGRHIHRVRLHRLHRVMAGELPLFQLPPQPERLHPLRTLLVA